MKKYKSIIYLFISCIISIGIIVIYQLDNFKVSKVDINTVTSVGQENEDYRMGIDKVDIGTDYVEIQGWALEKGVLHDYYNWVIGKDKAVYNNNEVVLVDESHNILAINTVAEDRTDINENIGDGINYSKCGFKALVKKSKLEANEAYKIGVIINTLENEKILMISEKEIIAQ